MTPPRQSGTSIEGRGDVDSRLQRLALPAILLLALVLRLVAASVPSIHHPDEVFQYLEAAHRLVFGYGIVPWEYHVGIRNWLFPLILAAPMALGGWLAPGGTLYLALPKALMLALSLVVPWTGWRLGMMASRTHALAAALVLATWSEFVYFAPHSLSENLATALLLPAVALLAGAPGRRALALAGVLLGLAVLARFQVLPIAGVLAAFAGRLDARRWLMLAAGGCVALAIGVAVDLATGMVPFSWLVANIHENILSGRAAQYGTLGVLGYVTWFEFMWNWWLIPLLPLVRLGVKRQPALFWAATANLVLLSLVGHKEYRFVEFTAVAYILLAAIGTVDAITLVRRRWPAVTRQGAFVAAALLWLAASASIATTKPMRANIGRATATLAATDLLRTDADACGIALLPDLVEWGGYAHLHRPLPINYFDANDPALAGLTPSQALRRWAPTYNRIIAVPRLTAALPPGYVRGRCFEEAGKPGPAICVYARPGGCADAAASPFLLQRVFDRSDQQLRKLARRAAHRLS